MHIIHPMFESDATAGTEHRQDHLVPVNCFGVVSVIGLFPLAARPYAGQAPWIVSKPLVQALIIGLRTTGGSHSAVAS